jgi:hypothetical protein
VDISLAPIVLSNAPTMWRRLALTASMSWAPWRCRASSSPKSYAVDGDGAAASAAPCIENCRHEFLVNAFVPMFRRPPLAQPRRASFWIVTLYLFHSLSTRLWKLANGTLRPRIGASHEQLESVSFDVHVCGH